MEVWDETQAWGMGNELLVQAWLEKTPVHTKMFLIESQIFICPFFFFFPSINSLQVELNNIFMLRKQLEEDVLGNRNLQKILQDQIKDMKNHQGLYPCPAQPSSCTKGKWFYYSQFAGMEKKIFESKKKVWKDFFLKGVKDFLLTFCTADDLVDL